MAAAANEDVLVRVALLRDHLVDEALDGCARALLELAHHPAHLRAEFAQRRDGRGEALLAGGDDLLTRGNRLERRVVEAPRLEEGVLAHQLQGA